MICPYCGREMKKGILSGDGRNAVSWKAGDKKVGFLERLNGSGRVTAAEIKLASFIIESFFCRPCRKMIFDTDVTK